MRSGRKIKLPAKTRLEAARAIFCASKLPAEAAGVPEVAQKPLPAVAAQSRRFQI